MDLRNYGTDGTAAAQQASCCECRWLERSSLWPTWKCNSTFIGPQTPHRQSCKLLSQSLHFVVLQQLKCLWTVFTDFIINIIEYFKNLSCVCGLTITSIITAWFFTARALQSSHVCLTKVGVLLKHDPLYLFLVAHHIFWMIEANHFRRAWPTRC